MVIEDGRCLGDSKPIDARPNGYTWLRKRASLGGLLTRVSLPCPTIPVV